MVYHEDEQAKVLKEKSRKAISLAMESRWEEAAAVNREVLTMAPNDLEACNRLGKALLETGDTEGARYAFSKALEISPGNSIAKKNLDRLACTPSAPRPATPRGTRLAHRMFISDSGKSAQVALFAPAPETHRPFLSSGDPVILTTQNGGLAVHSESGDYLGMVPPKLGQRLVRLMDGGNRYEGAVYSMGGDTIKVILRETYQHPSQRSRQSFPAPEPIPDAEPIVSQQPVPDDIGDDETDVDDDDGPLDLSWMESDDETYSTAGAAVGNAIDTGFADDPPYGESADDE